LPLAAIRTALVKATQALPRSIAAHERPANRIDPAPEAEAETAIAAAPMDASKAFILPSISGRKTRGLLAAL